MEISFILFKDFTALDVFGPAEVFSIPEFTINYYSVDGGIISNHQGINILTKPCTEIPSGNIIVIPGGFGTRKSVYDNRLIETIKKHASEAEYCLTVCTGSALLAQTGLLDGLRATSNKNSLEWVESFGKNISWDDEARYVKYGKFYTSSGVSAGIDMALAFITDLYGKEKSASIRKRMEYRG